MHRTRPGLPRRLTALIALISAGALVGSGIAWAATTDNLVPTANYHIDYCVGFSAPPGRLCQTDNAQVSYYMDSGGDYELETVDRNVVKEVVADEYQPTDLVVSYDSTPAFSGSSETDWIYQEGTVSGSAVGTAWCNDAGTGWKCDQHYIRIEGAGGYDYGTTCHESGHGTGLTHGNIASPARSMTDSSLGCMKTPTSSGDRLGTNNRSNINSVY